MTKANALDFDDFDALRQVICDRSGIWLNDSKVTFLQVRLHERLQTLGITSPSAYLNFLKYDIRGRQETGMLIDAVTVNESWFFRESEPVTGWLHDVLPALLETKRTLRLWSAGCAQGEEPYSLAMLLVETHGDHIADQVKIHATDINQQVLDYARQGVYPAYSLRHTSSSRQQRFFHAQTDDGRFQVIPQIRQMVQFERINLTDPSHHRSRSVIDLVLCRNVLIYFEEEHRKIVLGLLHQALRPDGYLLLGHSESLLHTPSPFKAVRQGKYIVYRR